MAAHNGITLADSGTRLDLGDGPTGLLLDLGDPDVWLELGDVGAALVLPARRDSPQEPFRCARLRAVVHDVGATAYGAHEKQPLIEITPTEWPGVLVVEVAPQVLAPVPTGETRTFTLARLGGVYGPRIKDRAFGQYTEVVCSCAQLTTGRAYTLIVDLEDGEIGGVLRAATPIARDFVATGSVTALTVRLPTPEPGVEIRITGTRCMRNFAAEV